jgi:hypothetical protein
MALNPKKLHIKLMDMTEKTNFKASQGQAQAFHFEFN